MQNANTDTSTDGLEIAIRENLQRALALSSELALPATDRIDLLSGVLQAMKALPTQPR
jgi:hypothetical protein